MRLAETLCCAALAITHPASAQDAPPSASGGGLGGTAAKAEQDLRQTFTNLQFEEFGPAPVRGPIYQAIAGGRVLYFAPESGHLLFAAVYDRNGINITAMGQETSARKRLASIDLADALVIGPSGAPKVIEFTDPDCPYCQALERFWTAKAAEGKPVQRLVYFVSGIHPEAAAKAEHILCSQDPEATFKSIYSGARPATLLRCKNGADKVSRNGETVRKMGVSGTPTIFVDGKLISGFQQAELEEFLSAKQASARASP